MPSTNVWLSAMAALEHHGTVRSGDGPDRAGRRGLLEERSAPVVPQRGIPQDARHHRRGRERGSGNARYRCQCSMSP